MAGVIGGYIHVMMDHADIYPDLCPGRERLTLDHEEPPTPRCWTHSHSFGQDYCPFLLWVARRHRSTARYADVLMAADEIRVHGAVVGRVQVFCMLAQGKGETVGA
jgi:hypothetical protein